jgi:hypothetical protein
MRRKSALASLAAAALLAAGCDRNATAPAEGALESADVALLAEELDALTGVALSSQIGSFLLFSEAPATAAPLPVDRSFTTTRQCPGGGSVTVAGTVKGETDRATRSLSLETNATRTENACAIPTRRAGGATLTVTGNPNVAIRGVHKAVNGQPSGPQTVTHKGAFSWSSSDGRSGSCALDLVSTVDFAALTYSVKGTLCGQTVDVTKKGVQPER